MSENITETVKLRPRVAEAVRVWDGLPSAERKYKAVAERMNITEGRAAVYVREGLVAQGRGDETPRGNGTRSSNAPAVSEPVAQMEALVATNEETVERLQAEIDEAAEAASNFTTEKFIAEEEARLRKAAEDAAARLVEWTEDKDDVASKAAAAEDERLTKRATQILTDHEKQLATAMRAIDAFTQTLDIMRAAEEQANEPITAGAPPEGDQPEGADEPEA